MRRPKQLPYKLLGNILIFGTIQCEQPLHIGGSYDEYRIGGLDNPIIREPRSGEPYIPGSSLRGKLRFLFEWATDNVRLGRNRGRLEAPTHVCLGIRENGEGFCHVCLIFGSTPEPREEEQRLIGPTRLLVRDAYLTEASRGILNQLREEKGIPMTEVKMENTIDRVISQANPRPMERVLKGTEFDLEMVYSVYSIPTVENLKKAKSRRKITAPDSLNNGKDDVEALKSLLYAMRLLEHSALGGSGSRGSGKVKLSIEREPRFRKIEDYKQDYPIRKRKYVSVSKIKDEQYLKPIKTALNLE